MRRSELVTFGVEKCAPDKRLEHGYSASFMLHFIQSGAGYYNGKKLTAGQGFLTISGKYFTYYPDREDPWYYAWVDFTDSDMLVELQSVLKTEDDMIFSFDTSLDYFGLIKKYHDEYGEDVNPEHPTISHDLREISYAGTALWYSMLALAATDRKCGSEIERTSVREAYVKKAKSRIDALLAVSTISIDWVASDLHISRAYLRNLFYEQCGESPQAYLIRQRIERACHLLEINDSPIRVIASSVGYTDSLQFSKIFHKYMGMSPSEYRAKHR